MPAALREPALDVTVPPARRVAAAGVRVHHADLPAEQVVRRDGLALTTPARTIADLAGRGPQLAGGRRARPRKEAAMRAMGLQVVRHSARQVEDESLRVLTDLARTLERLTAVRAA